jgi:hypothetical protein
MSNNNENPTVRRIVLPSGRSIEVIRFSEADPRTRELHLCPTCACDLVQPLSWSESSEGRWELTLECPSCWWSETAVYDRHQVEGLEDKLDEGLAEMIGDLQRLTQANMAADIERFIAALDAEVILPEDF